MNRVSRDLLYNCSASVLEVDITYLLGFNRSELFNVLSDALIRSTRRELLRAALTDCFFPGQERPFDLSWWQKLTWSIVFAAILFVATGGNIIVMWIVLAHRRMRTVTNYLLVNLSVADLMMSLLNCIFNFIFMLDSNWPFGVIYCTVNNFVANVTVASSVFTLVVISFDRLEKLEILHIKPLPIFGNMAPALFRRCTFAEVAENAYKLNDDAKYVGFYDFGEPVIMIRSPELIKNITVKHFDHFVDHRGFIDAERDPLFGRNLFSLHGDKWKNMRHLLSPAFTGSKMKAMFKLMSNCGKDFADYLSERTIEKPNVINSKDAFTRYTNDVIATCAFGISVDSMRHPKNEFYVLGSEAMNFDVTTFLKIFLLRSFPRIANFLNVKIVDTKVERFFEGIVRETMETRDREGITRPDMIQLMMESRGNKSVGKPEPTILDMTSQAFTFFLAGFDASSSLMCFVAHEIAVNPEIQKKLHDEIDEVMKETNGELTYDAINGMQYLDAVINETLRLFPLVVFLDRICVKPYELPPAFPGAKTVSIEPGQNIWFPAYFLHRDPKNFRDPNTFDPERFLGSGKNDIDPFSYIPFGQGPRMCIGNRFALLQTKVLFFHLLAKCYLKPSPKTLVPLELSKSSFAMTAKGGFWVQLESRQSTLS